MGFEGIRASSRCHCKGAELLRVELEPVQVHKPAFARIGENDVNVGAVGEGLEWCCEVGPFVPAAGG